MKLKKIVKTKSNSPKHFIFLYFKDESHLLQTETKKEYIGWVIALKRTAFSRVGGGKLHKDFFIKPFSILSGIFGQSLEDTCKYSLDKTTPVPLIVRQCCDFLLEYGTTFVGLFR